MRDYYEKLVEELRDETCCWCQECAGEEECGFALKAKAADAIEELLAVCKGIAAFVIHYADEDDVSAEVLCRKLHKIGVVEKDGAWWTLPKPPKEVE